MINVKPISSLEKVMLTDTFDTFKTVNTFKAAKGERVSFQVVVENPVLKSVHRAKTINLSVRSKLSKYIEIFRVGHVPSQLPVYLERCDDDYITKTPGMFPDILYPLKSKKNIQTDLYALTSFWVTVNVPETIESGEYTVNISVTDLKDNAVSKIRVIIDVKNTVIGKNDLRYTQWFHCDSIADYHRVKMMSDKHWLLIENYIKTAAHTGVNMMLTPLFTPPLDTAIDTERPTMQLVGVKKQNDKYEFDFTLLDKWVGICQKYGIQYFEMSHLFTQWGVCACPKIVVEVDGEHLKLFGWHVPSDSELYMDFLSQFLPALLNRLKQLDIYDNCYFHISDEPKADPDKPDFQNYLKAKTVINKYLDGCKIMDALSHVEFFDNGLIEYPVCATNHIEPFMVRDIKERWCYYCCSQGQRVANRFIAMPSYRNRVSGLQFYMNDIDGFLHWGYNFYYSKGAVTKINPYATTDALQTWPSGDPFSVYPYKNGAIESIRTVVFYEGLQDRLLLKQLEQKLGKLKTKSIVCETVGCNVTFTDILNADKITAIHDKILDILG